MWIAWSDSANNKIYKKYLVWMRQKNTIACLSVNLVAREVSFNRICWNRVANNHGKWSMWRFPIRRRTHHFVFVTCTQVAEYVSVYRSTQRMIIRQKNGRTQLYICFVWTWWIINRLKESFVTWYRSACW